MTVWKEFFNGLPEGFYSIKADALNTLLAEKAPFLLDVREASEIEKDGFIAGAVHFSVREVLKNLDKLPAQDQPIVVYCGSGHRGGMIVAALRLLGYADVVNLAGGLGAWKAAEFPVEMGTAMAEAVAGTAPTVDETRLRDLDAVLSALPDGFFTVKPADLNAELTGGATPLLLDLRTDTEYATGYIEGAVHIPVNVVFDDMSLLPADKAAPVVLLCQSGHRGGMVLLALRMLGWTEVRNLNGGMAAWVKAELPVVK
jgi:rhodanese-related sulfurtransferase